jgi:dienelactone hydrolase
MNQVQMVGALRRLPRSGCISWLALLSLFAFALRGLASTDSVFDVEALTSTPLNARVLKSTEKDGIVTEEVMFHSETDDTNNVEIFAFFSYPKGAEKLPAFIWNQGGLGQANTYWTEFGAKRGYATLCIDFPIPGYRSRGGYAINSGIELTDDPKKAPIYHGAVALLKAVSFLQSRKEVDKDRIGMAGSSWGGFYTTLMCGVDPRLKACSAMFGCGAMQLGNTWWDSGGNSAKRDAAFRERWRTTLDPALRLPKSKTPIGWFTGTDDFAYWMPALMASYAAAGGPKHLTLIPNWDHGLPEIGDEQVFAWVDAHLKGAPAFDTVTPLEVKGKGNRLEATWKFSGPRKIKSADLILSYGDAGNWTSRYWIKLDAKIKDGVSLARLPAAHVAQYVGGSVTDEAGFRYSTPLVEVNPGKMGVAEKGGSPLPDYDGCSEWGSFEPEQVVYLTRLGFMNPTVSTDSKEGKQSCVLKGTVTARNIYFTAGWPHRFTCFLKSEKEIDVKVALTGQFDGTSQVEEKTIRVGPKWTRATIDYTPPKCIAGGLGAVFTVPEGSSALLDCVSFRPARE